MSENDEVAYLPGQLFRLGVLIALFSFLVGFFGGIRWLAIVGGAGMVLYDVIGIWMGLLKPVAPAILALIGIPVLSLLGYRWYYGVFWSSALFGLMDIPYHITWILHPSSAGRRQLNQEWATQERQRIDGLSLEEKAAELEIMNRCEDNPEFDRIWRRMTPKKKARFREWIIERGSHQDVFEGLEEMREWARQVIQDAEYQEPKQPSRDE